MAYCVRYLVFAAAIFLGFSCAHKGPPLPLVRSYDPEVPCKEAIEIGEEDAVALYLSPISFPKGLSPEAGPKEVFEAVSLRASGGRLFFNDALHARSQSTLWSQCKLDLSGLKLSAVGGQFTEHRRFVPALDVLESLDSGYLIFAEYAGREAHFTIKPAYESSGYEPLKVLGKSRKEAKAGVARAKGAIAAKGQDGRRGRSGGDGSDGTRGHDGSRSGMSGGAGGEGGRGGKGADGRVGKNGSSAGERGDDGEDGDPGGHGGKGGRGGKGVDAGPGGRGSDGRRAENGPEMKIDIKPIYSRFYPTETLIYAEVLATFKDAEGAEYRKEKRNYIFHPGQSFRFESKGGRGGNGGRGGKGGEGGSGGAGGEGGSGGLGGLGGIGGQGGPADPATRTPLGVGGNGGDGGNGGKGGEGGDGGAGAKGGCGGPGGKGGNGGDGGRIRVKIHGDSAFKASVMKTLVFKSVSGEAGRGGAPGSTGAQGRPGAAGEGGSRGLGGLGGLGGFGGKPGAIGQLGAPGRDGKRGKSANRPSCRNERGLDGKAGLSLPVRFE